MSEIKNVLFVCAGNTCRSPFAEYFAKWLKQNKYKEQLKNMQFDSAGIYHYYETPQAGTVAYLKIKGIDISDFRAKKVTEELLEKQDLILTFEKKHHSDKLLRKFKHLKDLDKKVHLLLEFVGETENLEIPDPFHFEEKEYQETLKKIEEAVIKAIEKVIEINGKSKNLDE
ncbi:MAG: arsenate reductase/protein-tyrosine-phosphatase family protein [Promethearchaeota archaeon]